MANETILRLPAYPSAHARKSLSPSQLATMNQAIASALQQAIALPPKRFDTSAAQSFISSYAQDTARQVLDSLIWESQPYEKLIHKRALHLAEKLASTLDVQTLLDLAVIYASTNRTKLRLIFAAALQTTPSAIETELIPAFTALLSSSHGLYALRKTSYCITSFLRVSPTDTIRKFCHAKDFVLALGRSYDGGLASIAQSYGGLVVSNDRDPDEWERLLVETKVSLMDTFHIIITGLLDDLCSAQGVYLAAESERTFDLIFALLELPSSSSSSSSATPFLNRSLLADYQQSYDLSRTLASSLKHAAEKDARLDLLESTLISLDIPQGSAPDQKTKHKNPGALKILLRSSGIAPGIDNLGKGRAQHTDVKGKGKASPIVAEDDPELDIKTTQVLDIFPDHSPAYIRALLYHPAYPTAETVIEALLEGTAPTPEELDSQRPSDDLETYVLEERRNVFDDEAMDLTRMRMGKKDECAPFSCFAFLCPILTIFCAVKASSVIAHSSTT